MRFVLALPLLRVAAMVDFRVRSQPPIAAWIFGIVGVALLSSASGCRSKDGSGASTLVLAAYTTPREVMGNAIIPAFVSSWRESTGTTIAVQESYQASGAQARAVAEGFEADVVALSLTPDVNRLVDAGLVRETWDDGKDRGVITQSLVVIAVRPGNPRNIRDWADLARDDIEVLTPNVRTSGGAMWNVAAIYGAAMRGHAGTAKDDPAAAEALLASILARVKVMDKGARESIVNFENGVGDAAITYENEVIVAQQQGRPVEYVIPSSTVRIDAPAAVVHRYAESHGTTAMAEAFVAHLSAPDSQKAFAEYGFRPVDPTVKAREFPPARDVFTVDDIGGWKKLQEEVFAARALYDRALAKGRPE